MKGWTGERASHLLRGHGGTEVRVRLMQRTPQIPGVPGRPEPPSQELFRWAATLTLTLTPEPQ